MKWVLVSIIIYFCQDAKALECYTCYYVGDGAKVEDLPGDWKNWTALYSETCEHSPDANLTVNCDPLKYNPTIKKTCGKMTFSYVNPETTHQNRQYQITLRGCMEMASELADGECIDKSFRKLIGLSAVPNDFWSVMEWFPQSTYANVCSCTSDKCNATDSGAVDQGNVDAMDGGQSVTKEKSVWALTILLALLFVSV